MKYFAYGENMLSLQLRSIVPDAVPCQVGKIMGYKLFFHNRGPEDASGKCNIVPVNDPSCEIFGVLYDIPTHHRYLLDKAEDLGYCNQEIILKVFPVENACHVSETGLFAFTYVAHKDNIFEDLVPFAWYKDRVIQGAREHHLPLDYIHRLEQYACVQDPNSQRANKQKRSLAIIY